MYRVKILTIFDYNFPQITDAKFHEFSLTFHLKIFMIVFFIFISYIFSDVDTDLNFKDFSITVGHCEIWTISTTGIELWIISTSNMYRRSTAKNITLITFQW